MTSSVANRISTFNTEGPIQLILDPIMADAESVDSLLARLAKIAPYAPGSLGSELIELSHKLTHAVQQERTTAASSAAHHHHYYYGGHLTPPGLIAPHQTDATQDVYDDSQTHSMPPHPPQICQTENADVKQYRTSHRRSRKVQSPHKSKNEAQEQPASVGARARLAQTPAPPRLKLAGNAGKPSWREREAMRVAGFTGDDSATAQEAVLLRRAGYIPPNLRGKASGADLAPPPLLAVDEKMGRWVPPTRELESAYRPPGFRGH